MKRAVRTFVLVVGFTCTLLAAAPIKHGTSYAPAPICGPKQNEICR